MKKYITKNWAFDPSRRLLSKSGEKSILLPNNVASLLTLLCQNTDQLLDRYTIIDQIWDGNLTVGERGLRQIIWKLRNYLPDDENGEPAVINVTRKGYKLRDEVTISNLRLPKKTFSRYKQLVTLAISITVAWLLASQLYNKKVVTSLIEVTPVTTRGGFEVSPAVSPDNQVMLYSVKSDGEFNIYHKELEKQNITDKVFLQMQGDQAGMAWNKTGDKIAFLSSTQQPSVYSINIYDKTTETSTVVAEQYAPNISHGPYGLAWSPTQDTLAYTGIVPEENKSALFLYNYLSQEKQQLTQPDFIDMHPSWSPDGQSISFLKLINPELSGLYSIDIVTGKTQAITQSNIKIYGHIWLDDNYILYSAYDNGYFYPYVVELASLQSRRINIYGNFIFPSSSNADIYYTRSTIEHQIQQYKLFNNEIILEETINSTGENRMPVIHELTDQLVFISERSGFRELWYRSNQNAELTQLTHSKSVVSHPSFSMSGQKVLYRRYNPDSGNNEVQVYNFQQKKYTEIPVTNVLYSVFAGQDRYIAYITMNNSGRELWLYDLEQGTQNLLTKEIWTILGSDKDNATLFLVKSGQIHTYDLTTMETKPLKIQPKFQGRGYIQGSVLLHLVRNDQGNELIEHNLYSGEQKNWGLLSKTQFNSISDFSLNRHTKQIYLNIISKQESDIYKLPRKDLQAQIKHLFN